MREQEYRVPRAHGPKVAVIGGGHGLSNMLRGLKQYTENISAIVTVADDGGGSGMLRQDLGMPPPGDIRSCMEALANTEPVMRELLHYRFTEGSLAGQSFGNLFLAALNGISPSFDAAVRRMSQVLAITGRVLPVTTADVQLEAEFENGATVVGESKIFYCKKQEDCRIRQVRLIPSRPKALPEAVSAIADADMIVLGPGSLYTSIIPNLLVDGIVKAIRESDALKVYVCNVMTQEGETEGYTVSDHIAAIFAHSAQGLFRLCLTNSSPIPKAVAARYAEEGESGKLVFQITDGGKLRRIVDLLGFSPEQNLALHINFGLLEEECCRASFLRGVFFAGGSVTDPAKRYHLELATSHLQVSRELEVLLRECGYPPKSVARNGSFITYFKQSDQIEDFLTLIGAPVAAMSVMSAKLEKDLRNSVNRRLNCDSANLDKAVEAAQEQLESIRKLQRAGLLDQLPDKLQLTAALRLENPELTLSELAEEFDPPVTKSCLNHRLRKITQLAKGL